MRKTFKPCAVDGCENSAHYSSSGRKGFCCAHYNRLIRHGDPLAGGTPPGNPLRFIEEVVLTYSGDECLAWPYSRNQSGYGQIRFDGKATLASRYVCRLAHGEPPAPKHQAAHNCGKGHLGCVNPNHLEWKTVSENLADKLIHGTHQLGERNSQAKLTEADVREILALRGEKTQKEIAERFGVSRGTIGEIHQGRKWSWLVYAATEERRSAA